MKSSALATAKRAYASGARGVGKVLTRVRLLPEDPPPRDSRLKHWAYSLTRAHDSIGISELDVPWWTYDAIDHVEAWLADRDGVRAFEWGSGASTIWLAKRVESVHSVEHHRGFGEMMQANLAGTANATVEIVEAVESDEPKVPSAKEGHGGLDFAPYVERIHEIGGTYDLIVVDGRAREACLLAALDHLAADGIVVFDNTRRRRYQEAIDAAPVRAQAYRGLTPTLPYPDQTSIVTPA